MNSLIKIKNVSISYGSDVILSNLNLEFVAGKIYGLIGENGAGKSTFINVLSGALTSYSGNLILNSKSIGVVNQEVSLPDNFSAKDVLYFLAKLIKPKLFKKKIFDEINLALNLVGATSFSDINFNKLSNGMKMRILIAQAILFSPKILVFDEILSGLDPKIKVDIRNLILRLREKNRVIIISSHLLEDLELVCDEFLFVKNKSIVSVSENKLKSKSYILKLKEHKEVLLFCDFLKSKGIKFVALSDLIFSLQVDKNETIINEITKKFNVLDIKSGSYLESLFEEW
ncbi:ABC transporter ATP-binding protein [Candidatus Woesearchaeota archaeon]|nr:ABC transporter ATP-binding protein [Candidatus Woesearchaeota archaeon]MCF7900688.1 ABC transporter ATP-binding protein [Candidatus Woesearchaeota archaeon]MCF8013210.1 ABC transporter ATP-binding protein [Candidatus Woesearchaeota archaeon]